MIQPKDVYCKPGDKAEFTVSTSPSSTHTWYFNDQAISLPDEQNLLPEYEGQKSERLLILKVIPKHKGVYSCIAEDEYGTRITSKRVVLIAGTCRLLIFYLYDNNKIIILTMLIVVIVHMCDTDFYAQRERRLKSKNYNS